MATRLIDPNTIAFHLNMAAKKYEENANALNSDGTFWRLREQFQEQAWDARAMARALEGAKELGFAGSFIEVSYD